MATEPERPIEKMLREAARRRRDVARGPFELHPATRSLLQGEVARQFRKSKLERRSIFQALTQSGPKWAWGIAAASVVAVFGVMFWQAPKSSVQEVRFTKNEELLAKKVAAPATPAPASQPSDLVLGQNVGGLAKLPETEMVVASNDRAEAASTLKEADKDLVLIRGQTRNFSSAAGSAPASSLAQSARLAQEPAVGRQLSGVSDSAASPTSAQRYRQAAANSPTVEGSLLNSAKQAQATIWARQQFVQIPQVETSSLVKLKTKPPQNAVLASFRFEQAGNNLRVIDQDGSVYTGYVHMDNQMIPAPPDKTPTPALAVATQTRMDRLAAPMAKAAQQNDGSFAFQVAGSNVTLRQQVVFNGKFLPVGMQSNFALETNSQAGVVGGATLPQLQQAYNLLLNSRISGKASIAGDREVEINAEPAKQ